MYEVEVPAAYTAKQHQDADFEHSGKTVEFLPKVGSRAVMFSQDGQGYEKLCCHLVASGLDRLRGCGKKGWRQKGRIFSATHRLMATGPSSGRPADFISLYRKPWMKEGPSSDSFEGGRPTRRCTSLRGHGHLDPDPRSADVSVGQVHDF